MEIIIEWKTLNRMVADRQWSGIMTTGTFRPAGSADVFVNSDFLDDTGRPAGQIIIEWLRSHGARRHPITSDAWWVLSPPAYVSPGVYEDMIYLDLKSAYHSIYRHLTWDEEFNPTIGFSGRGRIALDTFPGGNRNVRNGLIGVAASRSAILWREGVPRTIKRLGGFHNPHLVQHVWGVLHAVALDCVRVGGVYWHIDGGILPAAHAETLIRSVSERYGLTLRPKSGVGRVSVMAVGAYRGDRDFAVSTLTTAGFKSYDNINERIAHFAHYSYLRNLRSVL